MYLYDKINILLCLIKNGILIISNSTDDQLVAHCNNIKMRSDID